MIKSFTTNGLFMIDLILIALFSELILMMKIFQLYSSSTLGNGLSKMSLVQELGIQRSKLLNQHGK